MASDTMKGSFQGTSLSIPVDDAEESASASNNDEQALDPSVSEPDAENPDASEPPSKEETEVPMADKDAHSAKKRKKVDLSASAIPVVDAKQAITLSFEHLTIHVPAQAGCCTGPCCRQIGGPLRTYAQEYMEVAVEERDAFYALDDISGYVRTGEMVLLLSSEQQYASTLLRALTGRSSSNDELSGTILLNGVPLTQDALQGWRRIAPYVSPSDASHSAVLTVRETIYFAAQCTADETATKASLNARVDRILEALDLSHVADTVVGDENLRGISGGQKRRVTVGEMMTDRRISFFGLDRITDGLASSDSLNLIEILSSVCLSFKTSAVISLLQPSDEIVSLFDKIMVLTSSGEMAYFGPVDRSLLRQVFLGSDDASRDTGSICDLVLSHNITDAAHEDDAQKRYVQTSAHDDLLRQLSQIRSNAPPARDRDIRVFLPDTKYSKTWFYQFRIIGARRLKLITRNAVTYTRIGIAAVFGVIIGSLFSALNNDLVGSLSRTGYMFLNCFLVLMLSAAITIPQTFRDRITLFKQRSAEFYSGRIAYLTQVLLDIPLSVLEAVLLSSISYFWVDMRAGANHFFYFLGVLVGLEFVGQAFGRFLCAVSRKQVYANSLSSVFLLIFGTLGGFMPGYDSIPPVFRWLSWITPASYAFEGLMINEFLGRSMSGIVVPSQDGPIEVGTVSGSSWIGNFGLPRANYASPGGIKGLDIAMLFILSLVFDMLGCIFVEWTRDWYFGQTRRPQSEVKSIDFKVEKDTEDEQPDANPVNTCWPTSLAVVGLSYYVPLPRKHTPRKWSIHSILGPCLVRCVSKEKGHRESVRTVEQTELRLLNGVSATFKGGKMTALMGTSGAGKTTLLDVIAGYKTGGRITGEVLVQGRPKETDIWRKISGYAEQMDILNPYLSTLETLRFTASCRLPPDVDREAVISDVVRLMDLGDYTDMIVGREAEGEGLPKHARKRLTIAVQLVTRPRILFADEPTTGLGTVEASLVMKAIRRCTDELGLITVVTIHQPSKVIWDTFDDLLLLVKGGNLAYVGPMGVNSQSVLEYFSKLSGLEPPAQANPADFVLDAVSSVSVEDAIVSLQRSSMYQNTAKEIASEEEEASNIYDESITSIRDEATQGKSGLKEIRLLTKRQLLTQWRNPSYSFMRLLASMFVSLYMGILFKGDKTTVDGAVFSIGAIFFLVFVLVIPMQASVVPLIEDRAVLYRETTSGLYMRLSYGVAQVLADVPFHMLNALVMFVCFYFLVGFQREGGLMGYFILMVFLANWVVMSLGQLFALATPNEESANGLAGLAVILSVILMGFLITVSAMPAGWVWAYWANLFHYIIQGFVTNELANNDYDLEIEKGLSIPIPGELILWVFGWAEWDEEDFEFVAPWKWWYCIFAVSMFLIGIEIMKLVAVTQIVWTKR